MITINTRLHDGIYKSLGGGRTRTIESFRNGPANLLKAVRLLLETQRENRVAYGDIGAGSTWLAIDHIMVDRCDIEFVELFPELKKMRDGDRNRYSLMDEAKKVLEKYEHLAFKAFQRATGEEREEQ